MVEVDVLLPMKVSEAVFLSPLINIASIDQFKRTHRSALTQVRFLKRTKYALEIVMSGTAFTSRNREEILFALV